MSKIVRLEAENIKRLRAVNIDVTGKSVVVIGGRNAQGKTSVLDSIEYALGGKPSADRPIRDGEKKAHVIVETEDIIVTRTFTSSGSRLEVAGRDGRIFKSPQAILDAFASNLSFDPLGFSCMAPKDQETTLKKLLCLDFSKMDADREQAYATRTSLNRDLKAVRAQASAIISKAGIPEKEIDIRELMAELERRQTTNQKAVDAGRTLAALKKMKADIEEDIVVLNAKLAEAEERRDNTQVKINFAEDEVSDIIEDVDAIKAQIATADDTNKAVRANAQRRELDAKVKATEEAADYTTKVIDDIDAAKQKAIASAKFPVEGLGFDADGVTYQGIPFGQCSSAEQLRVSVAIGMAMNPDFRVLLIRDGSLLDAANLKVLGEMAEKENFQLLIERVGDGEEVTVVIEDGQVQA